MQTKHRSGKRSSDSFSNENGGMTSSENLDEYIRVSKPGTKIVLAALLIVLAAVIVWGLIGKLPVTITVRGLVVSRKTAEALYRAQNENNDETEAEDQADTAETAAEGSVVFCFIDASRFNKTQVRNFAENALIEMPDRYRLTGTLRTLVGVPLSREECKQILFDNEWVTERCIQTDYSWWLIIEPDESIENYDFILADITIVTEEVAPISFLAGDGS